MISNAGAPGLNRGASVPRMNPTVEAALIAAGATLVAVTGTVTVAISAARNSRKATDSIIQAERRHRLLERRADAYQDALADLIARHAERQRQLVPVALDSAGSLYSPELPAYEPGGWWDKQGRLVAYGSSAVREAYAVAEKADQQLAVIYRERLGLADVATSLADAPGDDPAHSALGASLAELRSRMNIALAHAGAMDGQLTDAIRSELSPDPPSESRKVRASLQGPADPSPKCSGTPRPRWRRTTTGIPVPWHRTL